MSDASCRLGVLLSLLAFGMAYSGSILKIAFDAANLKNPGPALRRPHGPRGNGHGIQRFGEVSARKHHRV